MSKDKKKKKFRQYLPLIDREISWLSFNHRVLQEAMDTENPLIERLRFLGIYSNNRDEFFRVRVATVQRILSLRKQGKKLMAEDPEKVLEEIQRIVIKQQKEFYQVFNTIIRELEQEGIFILNEHQLNEAQRVFVREYFVKYVRPALVPIMLEGHIKPFLKDLRAYLYVCLSDKEKNKNIYSLIEIPSHILPRFVEIPSAEKGKNYIIMLEDVIRCHLNDIFSIFEYTNIESYTVKVTRDMELDIDEDDYSSAITDKLIESLKKRKSGNVVRLVYDEKMPEKMLDNLLQWLKIKKDSNKIIPGGRYHNLRDFMHFPSLGRKHLVYPPFHPVPVLRLDKARSILSSLRKRDILWHYPYHSFNYFIDLLREAAIDPLVSEISITLYRVADNSKVIHSLINAAANGKKVYAVVELKARFDEESNITWAEKLKEAGVKVSFGVPHFKVHGKLLLIKRKKELFAYIGTGNFNEQTAQTYTDIGFLTTQKNITREVAKVFDLFKNNLERANYRHLLVAPFNMRRRIYDLIDEEIHQARQGKKALIILKVNNLSDIEVIKKLYEAAACGVEIRIIARSTCSIVPQQEKISENIQAISIVGRFLEHERIFYFYHRGKEKIYISSADLMTRNLDRRIEIAAPITERFFKEHLIKLLDIQWNARKKVRILDARQINSFRKAEPHDQDPQELLYSYYQQVLHLI